MRKAFLSISILLLTLCVVGIVYLSFLRQPKESSTIEWDTSPDSVVIAYERRYDIDYNYIPAFRVWGDGYIVWVENMQSGSGKRKILDGYLSEDELGELLKKFEEADFFKQCHKNQSYALDYIRINLLDFSCSGLIDSSRTVNSNYGAISDLVNSLRVGMDITGKEFVPKVGDLSIIPYEKTEYFQYQTTIQPQFIWPVEKFGYEIEDIPTANLDIREKEIVGNELLFAWEVVNSHSPFVESNGKIYWITVTIPKISE